MTEESKKSVHWSFWTIAIVALLWNLLGCLNFVMQMNAEVVASMPETHRTIIESRPAWATGGFAIAVFGGALSGILLGLCKASAFYLFVASLLGVIVAMVHTLGLPIEFSAFEMFMMIVMPLVVGVLLVWYAKHAQNKNWIR